MSEAECVMFDVPDLSVGTAKERSKAPRLA